MSTEKIPAKDMTEFDGPVDTGDPHAKRPADKKVGDLDADTSVSSKAKKGKELPGATTVGEEIEALFSGVEGLSEGFATKAATLVEGVLSEKVSMLREEIESEYAERLEETVAAISEHLEEKLDDYLNLFIEHYMEDNKVAIERGFQLELAEQVIESVKAIVETAGVELPEEKLDIAESLVEENELLEQKYNSSLKENIALRKEIQKYQIKEAFEASTAGLSEAAKDKLRKLTENLEVTSVDQFVQKLEILKEGVVAPVAPSAGTLTEARGDVKTEKILDPRMAMYKRALSGLSN